MSQPLRWTKERLTEPGFYFYKTVRGSIDVCRVRRLDIDMWDHMPHRFTEWAGPITPPERGEAREEGPAA